ncbi:DUF4331 domain-containing protein [Streptomyces sp. Isolate_219]|uniref:DUF4331 domain-containing protein n=1 Tax=Streptomyces sp. Isolate_219 TaxID=2950110 RepID=UPI0021C5A4F3|nr:DUF4331 domain-containing protein [Streptomyces sp. Isolate_219]MCR8573097.1 DUF4331 domain-containing protein [Streptomyces sp. Isolate_219]
MSDHLDGLTAKNDPRLDISDAYVFHGQVGTVFVLNTNPGGSNGFHHEAVYELKIDVDGDAREEFTLRVTFGDRDWRGRQEATLALLAGRDAGNRDARGAILARTTTGKKTTGDGGVRFFAGTAGDPFYIEPTVVAAVRTAVLNGTQVDLSGYEPGKAKNLFAGKNVHSIVVEIPDHFFHGLRIGFWGSIAVPTDAGDAWRQTDRAAVPLLSTLFGFNEADDYNAAPPVADDTTWGHQIQGKIAKAVEANGYDGDGDAEEYADAARDILMPDILWYRIGTRAQFTGGRRNGRNLVENVAEEMFELVLHKSVDGGLDVDSATGTLRSEFPYLSKPV